MNQENLESNLSRYVTHVTSILESLPNPTGFREQGKSVIYFFGTGGDIDMILSNYFQGTRALLIKSLGSREH